MYKKCGRPSQTLLGGIHITCLYQRQIQEMGLREWQKVWETTTRGQECCNLTRRQRLGTQLKPTKLINTDQTTACTIHQLRLGHAKSFLIRLPLYDSAQCQCSDMGGGVRSNQQNLLQLMHRGVGGGGQMGWWDVT